MIRRVTIQTPLGEPLQFRKLDGTEALSELYSLDIDLVSQSKSIDPKALLGKSASVAVEIEGLGKRYLSGLVTHFGMQGQDHRWASYKLRLRPWLWVATRKTDFRIFQHMTVPDIIMDVLGKYGFPIEKRLARTYRTWDYCTQYGESDYNFVARLLEHEGAYYYFTHSAGSHMPADKALQPTPLSSAGCRNAATPTTAWASSWASRPPPTQMPTSTTPASA